MLSKSQIDHIRIKLILQNKTINDLANELKCKSRDITLLMMVNEYNPALEKKVIRWLSIK